MRSFDNVAIVGVGLIGGSIGLALRQRKLAGKVIGIGRRQSSLRIARQMGAVDTTTINLARGVAEAELIFVCTPVGQIPDHIRQVAEHCPVGALITDVGSTKQVIVESVDGKLPRQCRFLGGHPIAGGERTGPAHARADLFDGRVTVLTPTKNTLAEDFDTLSQLWSQLGAVVVRMSPEEHDKVLAMTSHLPHLVAAALAGILPEELFRFVGTGFLDTTRIAAGSPELWRDIFVQNRQNVQHWLGVLQQKLNQFGQALARGDAQSLESLLEEGKRHRDALAG
ncbi:MAG: prephenate dehydrogenase [Thermoguttaceae bacterium]|nr:prephenate dehydrogenase [Thermoguttaceae bacterium]MDW8080147.1 prephenate dehydrogenase [Thermoguttaceae bacterium]